MRQAQDKGDGPAATGARERARYNTEDKQKKEVEVREEVEGMG